MSLSEFADKVGEIMPAMFREFIRSQPKNFYKSHVTPPQIMVLTMLEKMGESRMTDLSRALGVTTAAMTGIADRLVRDGYAARASDPKDRRIVRINITARGARIVKEMLEHRKKLTMKMFGTISQKEREEYLKILMHVRAHLK
jgi:DNA-binding MarR family transcriptional regulator